MSSRTCSSACGFLSTPSGWRATVAALGPALVIFDFYPRPPGGGRLSARLYRGILISRFLSTPSGWRATWDKSETYIDTDFLSTPSGWRATIQIVVGIAVDLISIHALRVEGDAVKAGGTGFRSRNFYPRPPGGGRRQQAQSKQSSAAKFLSTPSGWRATGPARP